MEPDSFRRTTIYKLLWSMLLWVSLQSTAHSQDSLWIRHDGGFLNDNGYACRQLPGGDVIIAGSTFSFGAGDYDMYLVRLDSTGNMIWNMTYGGADTDCGYDLLPLAGSSVAAVGSTKSFGHGKRDIYLVKINSSDGSLIWSKTYGGVEDDDGCSIRSTLDNGFVICGTTNSFGGGSNIYLIRTDSLGDTLWTRSYGGPAGETGGAVRTLSDGGFIIVGSTGSYGVGYSSVYLIRVNQSGDTLWTATYGGSRADMGYDVQPTSDNGFIIAGTTAPAGQSYYDAYLVKTDSLGHLEWEKNYGGAYEDRAYSVAVAGDGGYVFTGTSESSGGRQTDIFLVKTDPVGNAEWSRAYGGMLSDFGRGLAITPQSDFLISGYSYTDTYGGSDIVLLKVRGEGGTPADWNSLTRPDDKMALSQNYPNPFNLATRIEFSLPRRASYHLAIYNILGQIIRRWDGSNLPAGNYSITWDGHNEDGGVVPSGIYLYQIQADGAVATKKMALIK
jgi:hypothetical protein